MAPDFRKPTFIPPHQPAQRLFAFLSHMGFLSDLVIALLTAYVQGKGAGTSFKAGCTWHTGTHVLGVELRMVPPLVLDT